MSVQTTCPKCGATDYFSSMVEVTSQSVEVKIPACLYCDICNTVMVVTNENYVDPLTKEQVAIIGLFTGIACGPFADIQELAEKVTGRPIFTHEFANKKLFAELKEEIKHQFIALCYIPPTEDE